MTQTEDLAGAVDRLAAAIMAGFRQRSDERVSYTLDDAAAVTGVSLWSIRRAIDAGELVTHRPRPLNKPLILARDLTAWIEDGPSS